MARKNKNTRRKPQARLRKGGPFIDVERSGANPSPAVTGKDHKKNKDLQVQRGKIKILIGGGKVKKKRKKNTKRAERQKKPSSAFNPGFPKRH